MKATSKLKLTPKQEKFYKRYISNDFNGVEACKFAGYKGTDGTLAVVANENLRKPNIMKAIAEAQKKDSKKLEITRESLLNDIQVAKDMALTEEQPQFQAYLKAIELQAKMLGLNEPDKVDMNATMQVTTVPTFADFKKR
jgi:phage terminase small subunit